MSRFIDDIRRSPLGKIIIALLILVVLAGLWLFGRSRQNNLDTKKDTVKITKTVLTEIPKGVGKEIYKSLPENFKIEENKDINSIGENLVSGKTDLAILKTSQVISLINDNKNFKVIGTLTLMKRDLVANNKERIDGKVEDLVNRNIQVIDSSLEEEPQKSNDDNNGKTVSKSRNAGKNANQKNSNTKMKEKTTEEIALGALFKANSVKWSEKNVAGVGSVKDVEVKGAGIVISNADKSEELIKTNGRLSVKGSLGDIWQGTFQEDIPEYVIVASNKFVETRNSEVDKVIEGLSSSQNINKNVKAVDFSHSNRGTWLVREFLKKVEIYNSNTLKKGVNIDGYFYN